MHGLDKLDEYIIAGDAKDKDAASALTSPSDAQLEKMQNLMWHGVGKQTEERQVAMEMGQLQALCKLIQAQRLVLSNGREMEIPLAQ